METPTVSVIMGIYNCADYLPDAIESIINQTFKDWELIMCDDGSIDQTFSIASDYKNKFPEKIVLLRNEKNRGLNYTLNKCLASAKGKYIARMDGDDLCSPERFETEVNALNNDHEISIVSTDMSFFDESGTWGKISHTEYPKNKDFVHGSPFCHAPCMVRHDAYKEVKGYSEGRLLLRVEDYHLWIKMYSCGLKGKNINKVLYQMRDDRNAYSRRKFKYRINEAYVRIIAVHELRLPKWMLIYSLRPIIVGLMPPAIYQFLHKHRLSNKADICKKH